MSITWQDASEVVVGLVLDRRMAVNSVCPELLFEPYNKIIAAYKDGLRETELLIEKFGLSPIQTCLDAAHNLNGTGELNWTGILEQTCTAYDAGVKLEKFGQRMQRGDPVDYSQVTYYAKLANTNKSSKFTPLSDVEECDMPYIKTGWKPIDEQLFGIPKVGLIVIGGATGSGKTWLFTKLASCFVQEHPDQNVAFFSLEMMLEEIKLRFKPYKLPQAAQERILLYPHPTNVDGIIAQATTVPHLGLVGVDFADLLVRGEISAASMEVIYKTLVLGAKELGVPIVLLAQLTGYDGNIPKPDTMRWTRMAQMLAWSAWTIWNPLQDWFSAETLKSVDLPWQRPNSAFLCAWKMRGGFWKEGADKERVLRNDDPIAIHIPYKVNMGWGDQSKSYSLRKYS